MKVSTGQAPEAAAAKEQGVLTALGWSMGGCLALRMPTPPSPSRHRSEGIAGCHVRANKSSLLGKHRSYGWERGARRGGAGFGGSGHAGHQDASSHQGAGGSGGTSVHPPPSPGRCHSGALLVPEKESG